jgi:hypothetical protein
MKAQGTRIHLAGVSGSLAVMDRYTSVIQDVERAYRDGRKTVEFNRPHQPEWSGGPDWSKRGLIVSVGLNRIVMIEPRMVA